MYFKIGSKESLNLQKLIPWDWLFFHYMAGKAFIKARTILRFFGGVTFPYGLVPFDGLFGDNDGVGQIHGLSSERRVFFVSSQYARARS